MNKRPVNIELLDCFSNLGASHMAMLKITGVPQGNISKVSLCIRDIGWRRQQEEINVSFLLSWKRTGISQRSWSVCSWSCHLEQYLCLHGPKIFTSGWISPKTSRQVSQTDSWSSPPATHRSTSPELEQLAQISSDICWGVPGQPLTLLFIGC